MMCLLTQPFHERRPFHLFSGTTPALFVAVLENSVVFGANSLLRQSYRAIFDRTDETLLETAGLGGLSGIVSAAVISPAETIKIRLQYNKSIYGCPTHCIRRIIQEEGLIALFRGLPAQVPRDSLFNFFFFSSFEACSRLAAHFHQCNKNELGVVSLILAGGVAGATGWSFTLPFDVVKSRSQSLKCIDRPSSWTKAKQITADIYNEFGFKGFFRGWGAAIFRAFPVNGIIFASYSLTERAFQGL